MLALGDDSLTVNGGIRQNELRRPEWCTKRCRRVQRNYRNLKVALQESSAISILGPWRQMARSCAPALTRRNNSPLMMWIRTNQSERTRRQSSYESEMLNKLRSFETTIGSCVFKDRKTSIFERNGGWLVVNCRDIINSPGLTISGNCTVALNLRPSWHFGLQRALYVVVEWDDATVT